MTVINKPPANATTGNAKTPAPAIHCGIHNPPKTIATDAANAAPLDTPIKPGSARGLRNKPCMQAPATANPAPTKAAKHVRGKRICQIMLCQISPCPETGPCHSICHTCDGAIVTAPNAKLASMAPPNSSTNTAINVDLDESGDSHKVFDVIDNNDSGFKNLRR